MDPPTRRVARQIHRRKFDCCGILLRHNIRRAKILGQFLKDLWVGQIFSGRNQIGKLSRAMLQRVSDRFFRNDAVLLLDFFFQLLKVSRDRGMV